QHTITRSDHALIPGLVNAHTHAAMSLLRGFADDLPLMDWLQNYIWPAEGKWVNESFVADGTRLAALEMLRGGTTCFSDMYFFPDRAARAAIEVGIRSVVGLIAIEAPTVWASSAREYLSKGTAVHDELKNEPLVTTTFAPHAPYTVSDETLSRITMLAEELDIPIHMHLHETQHEVDESLAASKRRPLARLRDLGVLSPRLIAVHMTALEDDEVEMIATHGVHVVHCPESNLKLASGMCRVAALQAAGVNVAIGTDGAASNNDLDMLAELRLASLLAKGVSGSATALPASAALEAATLNGARALGLGHEIGSLIPGKAADIVALDMSQPETQPLYNPLSQVVYSSGREQVTDVWVHGEQVLAERQPTRVDTASIVARAEEWRERISHTDESPR
ncbi:MAG: TRZ/ATZ family hydrolase, partial [Gammaproteobacteria bacterium]|nr:TRZ/ATZ family hydrolase [Gammaproteobacteria bacterium]